MDSGVRWGIIERLAAVGVVAGGAGVVASMTAPPWLQDFLASSGLGAPLFWGSLTVFVLAFVFSVCDLGLHLAQKVGAKKLLGALLIAGGICAAITGLVLLTDSSTPPKQSVNAASADTSRLIVTKFILQKLNPSDPNSNYFWKIYILNNGRISGYAPMLTLSTRIADARLTNSEIDGEMAKAVATGLKDIPSKSEQVEINQEEWVQINKLLVTAADMELIKSGKKLLYAWIVLRFTDDAIKDNSYWISEYCGSPSPDFSNINICSRRTYLYSPH